MKFIGLVDHLSSQVDLPARLADPSDFHAMPAGHRAAAAVDVVLPLLDVAADPGAFRIADRHEGDGPFGNLLAREAHAAADFIPLGPGPAAAGQQGPAAEQYAARAESTGRCQSHYRIFVLEILIFCIRR